MDANKGLRQAMRSFKYRSYNEVYHSSQLWWQQLDGKFKPPLLGGELKPTLSDIAAMNYKSALKKKVWWSGDQEDEHIFKTIFSIQQYLRQYQLIWAVSSSIFGRKQYILLRAVSLASLVVLIINTLGYISLFRVQLGQNCMSCHSLG